GAVGRREGRRAPVAVEGLVPHTDELADQLVLGNVAEGNDVEAGGAGAVEGPLPPLDELARDLDLVVDPALLRLEAGVLEEGVVVARVLTDEVGRQVVVRVDRERELAESEAAAG